jgi:diphthamide synthase (EF-2-diphthine--ammonia ligase)
MESINERVSAAVALVILMLFATVLTYWIIEDASYPADWKEARNFNLSVKSCGEAERKAKADFERGVIRMYFSSGVMEEHHNGFPYNFYKRLEEDFGIDVIYTGDVYSSFQKCYNLEMDELLADKVGEDTISELFQKMHREKYGRQP